MRGAISFGHKVEAKVVVKASKIVCFFRITKKEFEAMTFQPGQAKIPGSGRKKGTPNKRTAAISDALADMAIKQLPNLEWQLENMYGAQNRANTILKLLKLMLPRGTVAGEDAEPDAVSADSVAENAAGENDKPLE
jgi:hypothetical protein